MKPPPTERAWLDELYRSPAQPLAGWQVWVASYGGAQPFWYTGHDVVINEPRESDMEYHGVYATVMLGHLVAQAISVREPDMPGPVTPVALRIWPQSPAPLSWPPAVDLDDDFLNVLRIASKALVTGPSRRATSVPQSSARANMVGAAISLGWVTSNDSKARPGRPSHGEAPAIARTHS